MTDSTEVADDSGEQQRWLTPGVAGIGTASLLADVGHEIPTALLRGRRTVAVGGYTTTAVLSAGIGAATATWHVALLRAGAWTARGLRVPARNALLADVVPADSYGRAYGFKRAMDNLGAIIGPLAAIGLVAAVGTRWAIGLSVLPGLLAAIAIVYATRHTPRPTSRAQRRPLHLAGIEPAERVSARP